MNGAVIHDCFLCGKKIDPSKPEEMIVGKHARFYHRNCKRRLEEKNQSLGRQLGVSGSE